jgi:hypothetical protein
VFRYAGFAIPIHYNDYEAFKSPLEDFERAINEAGLEDRVHYLAHGDTYGFEVQSAPRIDAASRRMQWIPASAGMTGAGARLRFTPNPVGAGFKPAQMRTALFQSLLQDVIPVALGIIRDVRDDLVAELLVERPRLEAEGRQVDAVASLGPGLFFGGFE